MRSFLAGVLALATQLTIVEVFEKRPRAVVIPARVATPTDKPKVEVSVQIAQRWILAVLRHRTFFTLADLNVAIWSLWNYVMGATVTRASFDFTDDDRAAAQQRLSSLSERYPTIERSRLLMDDDWDGAFRKGLDFLLDGLAPR